MSKFINYKRIVIYQPRNAWVVDLGPGRCKAPLYDPSERYFRTGKGTSIAVSRTRRMIIEVFDESMLNVLRVMHKEGCEMRAICIGDDTAIVWEFDSAFNLVETNGGLGGFAGANLVFNSDVQWCSVFQAKDLLSGIPWACETATDIGGTFYLPGPDGWVGNRWVASSGDSVDEDGAATVSSSMTFTMYFPLEGATVNFSGTWTGSINFKDHSGSNLSTLLKNVAGTDASSTVPDGTWTIQVNVSANTTTRPEMYVTNPGSLKDPRRGGCIDCTDLDAELGSAPGWSS